MTEQSRSGGAPPKGGPNGDNFAWFTMMIARSGLTIGVEEKRDLFRAYQDLEEMMRRVRISVDGSKRFEQ